MASSGLLPIVLIAGGIFLFKDQITAFLQEQGIDLGNLGGKKEDDAVVAPVPSGTANQQIGTGLSQITISTDYYAGKIAQAITRMSADNIFDATRVKEEIVGRYIGDVRNLAKIMEYSTEDLAVTNAAAIKIFALVVVKTVSSLRITMKQKDRIAVETVAGVMPGSIPQATIVNIYAHLAETFNNAPPLTSPAVTAETGN